MAPATTGELRDLLTWARKNRFRVSHVEMGGIVLDVDDLVVDAPGKVEPGPRSVHEAFARQAGLPPPPEDEDDEGDVA